MYFWVQARKNKAYLVKRSLIVLYQERIIDYTENFLEVYGSLKGNGLIHVIYSRFMGAITNSSSIWNLFARFCFIQTKS